MINLNPNDKKVSKRKFAIELIQSVLRSVPVQVFIQSIATLIWVASVMTMYLPSGCASLMVYSALLAMIIAACRCNQRLENTVRRLNRQSVENPKENTPGILTQICKVIAPHMSRIQITIIIISCIVLAVYQDFFYLSGILTFGLLNLGVRELRNQSFKKTSKCLGRCIYTIANLAGLLLHPILVCKLFPLMGVLSQMSAGLSSNKTKKVSNAP